MRVFFRWPTKWGAPLCLLLFTAADASPQEVDEQQAEHRPGPQAVWTGMSWEPVLTRKLLENALSVLKCVTPELPVLVDQAETPVESHLDEHVSPDDPEPPSPWAELDLALYAAATSAIPAGIPASRRSDREAARALARDRFKSELGGPQGALWERYIEERLRYGRDRAGAWSSAADLVVQLESFKLSAALATGLSAPRSSLVGQVAHASLAELFGRDFEGLSDFNAFTEGLVLQSATLRLIGDLRAERNRSRERLLRLFAYDRQVAVLHLADPDPQTRLGAAQMLAAALHDGQAKVEEVLPMLLDRAATERWPAAVEVLLDAAVDALDGRSAGDPLVEQLRGDLAENVHGSSEGLELLVARALARLPWPAEVAADNTSIESGAGLISSLLRRVTVGEDETDFDVILGVLQALDGLCVATGGDLKTARRLAPTEVRLPLLALAFGDRRETAARVVAVGILPRVAPPEGLLDLIRLVSSERSENAELPTSLRFAAMGAMGRFANRGDAHALGLNALATCLVENVARPEADLRRRALQLLANDALSPELNGRGMQLFVSRLEVEEQPDLQTELVHLIGRHGGSSDLTGILNLGNFDQLAARDLGLESLIERLAGGEPELAFEGAERLWSVQDSVGLWARRGGALGIVARLSPESAATLSSDQHRVVANWASQLRDAGVSLVVAMPGGVEFLERLVHLHLPKSGSSEPYWLAEQNLLAALFLSDLAAARGPDEAVRLKDEVLAKFARAEELAADRPTTEFAFGVRRSRARFLVASSDAFSKIALADYLYVFDSDFRYLLDTADFRSAGQLAAEREDVVSRHEAWRFSEALLAHSAWSAEPVAVRLGDLRQFVARALASGDPGILASTEMLFDSLPEDPAGSQDAVQDVSVWRGLLSSAGALKEFHNLQAQLKEASRGLAENASEDAAEGPTPTSQPSIPPEGEADGGDSVLPTKAPSKLIKSRA